MLPSLVLTLSLSLFAHSWAFVPQLSGLPSPNLRDSVSTQKRLFCPPALSNRLVQPGCHRNDRTSTASRFFQLRASTCSEKSSDSAVPITLLGGFLGTGKTTVLKHILENKEGLKVGVIVNDVAEVNIDAKLVRDADSVAGSNTVELQCGIAGTDALPGGKTLCVLTLGQNGCACCSGSEELFSSVEQILELGRSRGEPFDHVIIELSGVAEPAVVKANFEQGAKMGMSVAQAVEISNVVTVVDTSAFVDEWMTEDTIGQRSKVSSEAEACSARRPVAEFLAEQVEAADRVVLNKVDMASVKERETAAAVVGGLLKANDPNRATQVVEATYGKVPLSFVVPQHQRATEPSCHNHDCKDPTCTDPSHQAAQERDDSECTDPTCDDPGHAHSHSGHAHSHTGGGQDTTAKQRLGIESFVYRARRPFDEERLFELVDSWPVPSKNLSLYLTSLVTGGLDGELQQSPLQSVVRSKGFLWLAANPRAQMFWSHAGRHFGLEPSGKCLLMPQNHENTQACTVFLFQPTQTWADLPPSVIETAQDQIPEKWAQVQAEEFQGEFGDRRQELVFIGPDMDKEAIKAALDHCLVREEDMDEFRARLQAAIDLEAHARFGIGEAVACRLSDWEPGTVVEVGYREPDWPLSKPDAPYQVQLDTGALIWVPEDTQDYIRAR